jgi:hypothetical protein
LSVVLDSIIRDVIKSIANLKVGSEPCIVLYTH